MLVGLVALFLNLIQYSAGICVCDKIDGVCALEHDYSPSISNTDCSVIVQQVLLKNYTKPALTTYKPTLVSDGQGLISFGRRSAYIYSVDLTSPQPFQVTYSINSSINMDLVTLKTVAANQSYLIDLQSSLSSQLINIYVIGQPSITITIGVNSIPNPNPTIENYPSQLCFNGVLNSQGICQCNFGFGGYDCLTPCSWFQLDQKYKVISFNEETHICFVPQTPTTPYSIFINGTIDHYQFNKPNSYYLPLVVSKSYDCVFLERNYGVTILKVTNVPLFVTFSTTIIDGSQALDEDQFYQIAQNFCSNYKGSCDPNIPCPTGQAGKACLYQIQIVNGSTTLNIPGSRQPQFYALQIQDPSVVHSVLVTCPYNFMYGNNTNLLSLQDISLTNDYKQLKNFSQYFYFYYPNNAYKYVSILMQTNASCTLLIEPNYASSLFRNKICYLQQGQSTQLDPNCFSDATIINATSQSLNLKSLQPNFFYFTSYLLGSLTDTYETGNLYINVTVSGYTTRIMNLTCFNQHDRRSDQVYNSKTFSAVFQLSSKSNLNCILYYEIYKMDADLLNVTLPSVISINFVNQLKFCPFLQGCMLQYNRYYQKQGSTLYNQVPKQSSQNFDLLLNAFQLTWFKFDLSPTSDIIQNIDLNLKFITPKVAVVYCQIFDGQQTYDLQPIFQNLIYVISAQLVKSSAIGCIHFEQNQLQFNISVEVSTVAPNIPPKPIQYVPSQILSLLNLTSVTQSQNTTIVEFQPTETYQIKCSSLTSCMQTYYDQNCTNNQRNITCFSKGLAIGSVIVSVKFYANFSALLYFNDVAVNNGLKSSRVQVNIKFQSYPTVSNGSLIITVRENERINIIQYTPLDKQFSININQTSMNSTLIMIAQTFLYQPNLNASLPVGTATIQTSFVAIA